MKLPFEIGSKLKQKVYDKNGNFDLDKVTDFQFHQYKTVISRKNGYYITKTVTLSFKNGNFLTEVILTLKLTVTYRNCNIQQL